MNTQPILDKHSRTDYYIACRYYESKNPAMKRIYENARNQNDERLFRELREVVKQAKNKNEARDDKHV